MEMDEMEGLRIQCELDKLRGSWSSLTDSANTTSTNNNNTNGIISSLIDYPTNKRDRPLSRTLSNSLLDMTLTMPVPSICKFSSIVKIYILCKFYYHR